MAKKIILDLVPIWRDRGMNKDLKMPKALTKADEKRIESADMWIYRRMLLVSRTEHRTYQRILAYHNTTRQLL